MGGDHGLRASLPAALKSLKAYSDLELILVGDGSLINQSIPIPNEFASRVSVVHTTESVSMDEKPSRALRGMPDSSMRRCVELLKENRVDGVVSAGNTGALMAIGCHLLKTIKGIDRPAFCAAVPRLDGVTFLLDLGANLECNPAQLHQFAVMGSALSSSVSGNENPPVALLNVGEEHIKGNKLVKEAAALISSDLGLNYVGYLEGGDIYSAKADVVVCDGFVGNAVLKACEGTAHYIRSYINTLLKNNNLLKLYAGLGRFFFKETFESLNPDTYNGASFLGLQGVIVKSHGDSNDNSFFSAISLARKEVKGDIPALIANHMNERNN